MASENFINIGSPVKISGLSDVKLIPKGILSYSYSQLDIKNEFQQNQKQKQSNIFL